MATRARRTGLVALLLALIVGVGCASRSTGRTEDVDAPDALEIDMPDAIESPDTAAPDGAEPHEVVTPGAVRQMLAIGEDGALAAVGLEPPWQVLATGATGAAVSSARYHAGRYLVVHPAPASRLDTVDAVDLSIIASLPLDAADDPRDVAFVDEHTAMVSLAGRAALLRVDLATGQRTEVDLGPLADPDGNPDARMLGHCGARVFVQLQRDSATPGLGVVDVDATGGAVLDVDPFAPGVQGIVLHGPPLHDMQVDCAASLLYVAEPLPLMLGGSRIEVVDLQAFAASTLSLPIPEAEGGGFVLTAADAGWVILHTEFGPAPSSHLFHAEGGQSASVWDTFADQHVNSLALDAIAGHVVFPDPCTTACPPGHRAGLVVLDASSGQVVTPVAIDVGFPPTRVVVARDP